MQWMDYWKLEAAGNTIFWNGKQTLVKFPAKQSSNFLSCYTIMHALYIKTVKKKNMLCIYVN